MIEAIVFVELAAEHWITDEGNISANRDTAGEWETFTVEGLPGAAVNGGESVHLRTSDGIHYLCAEGGGGGEVNTTRDAAGGWETFTLEVAQAANPRLQLGTPAHVDLGAGHHMETSFTTTSDGAVRAHTKLTCTNKIIGFTGGVTLIFADKNGNKLGSSDTQQWGINQGPLIGAEHREIDWFASAPPGTNDIALIQFWDPKPRFDLIFKGIETVIADIAIAVQFIGEFCAKYPDFCSAVEEVFSSSDGGNAPA